MAGVTKTWERRQVSFDEFCDSARGFQAKCTKNEERNTGTKVTSNSHGMSYSGDFDCSSLCFLSWRPLRLMMMKMTVTIY